MLSIIYCWTLWDVAENKMMCTFIKLTLSAYLPCSRHLCKHAAIIWNKTMKYLPTYWLPHSSVRVDMYDLAKSNKLYRHTYNLTYNLAEMILYMHPSLHLLQFLLFIVKL